MKVLALLYVSKYIQTINKLLFYLNEKKNNNFFSNLYKIFFSE